MSDDFLCVGRAEAREAPQRATGSFRASVVHDNWRVTKNSEARASKHGAAYDRRLRHQRDNTLRLKQAKNERNGLKIRRHS